MIKEIIDNKDLLFFNKYNYIYDDKNPFVKNIGYYVDNNLVGALSYEYIYDRIEIDFIVVEDKYRQQGIASYLIQYIVDLKPINITLEVRENNIPAINLYKKFNFEVVSKRPKYYGNIDGLLMIRR